MNESLALAKSPPPEWRQNAKAGVPLSQAKPPEPPAPAAPAAAQSPANPMTLMIRPNVRDRWMSGLISYYTPQLVETTVRSAMSGNLVAQWQMFDLMEQTWPMLSKCLNELKDAVIDLDWNLQPYALKGEKPTPEAQRRARIVEHVLWNMRPNLEANENDFEDTIRDALDAVGKGISVLEIDWAQDPVTVNIGGASTQIIPIKATRWVHPRYYGYPTDQTSEDRLMLNAREIAIANPQFQANGLWLPFPQDKFITAIIKQKSGHPLSGSLLRILGFWWAASNFAWEWFLNYAQIFGVPLRWATFAPDAKPQTISLLEDMLAAMGSSGYAAFPQGTLLEIKEAAGNAKDNPQKVLIDTADTIASLLILRQTLTSQQGDRGSQALGNVHKDVRDEKVKATGKSAAKILNLSLIPAICRVNFGDDSECPWLQPSAKETKDAVAVATKYKELLSIQGVSVSKQQFYEDNDLVMPDEGDETIDAVAIQPGGFGGGDPSQQMQSQFTRTATAHAHAADSTEKLVTNVLERLTGVDSQWLGAIRPVFEELIAKAKDSSVSDADFLQALQRSQKQMPQLFHKLNAKELENLFFDSMSAAAVNGAVRGYVKRGNGGGR